MGKKVKRLEEDNLNHNAMNSAKSRSGSGRKKIGKKLKVKKEE